MSSAEGLSQRIFMLSKAFAPGYPGFKQFMSSGFALGTCPQILNDLEMRSFGNFAHEFTTQWQRNVFNPGAD